MKIWISAVLTIASTVLLTFSALALVIGPPTMLDSRALLLIAVGVAGVILGVLAFRELRAIDLSLRHLSATR